MSRGDQITRQWRILRLLEGRKTGYKVTELHEELGASASERTLFRDLNDLTEAGFPLCEVDGRWTLPDGGALRSLPILPTEYLAVLLAVDLLDRYQPSEIAIGLRSLRDKIDASLVDVARKYSRLAKESLLATYAVPGASLEGIATETIEEAIRLEHRIAIVYASPGKAPTHRRVDPYCLWFADGRLYVIGWCHLRKDFRTFHLSRIREVEVLDEAFDRDPSFDAATFVGAGFGVWVGEPHDVELVFEPEVAHVPAERTIHATQAIRDLAGGGVLVTFRSGGLPQLATWLAGFGGLVRVMKPLHLRDMVLQIHQGAIEAYCSEDQRIGPVAG